jgi:rSAM/selenodomain-associated transferase 1
VSAPAGPPAAALVMARAPVAGLVKTRLEPVFTPAECAELQAALIRRTARWAVEVAPGAAFLALDGPAHLVELLVPSELTVFPQRGAHLGERLRHATGEVFARGHTGPLLVVGTDTRLTTRHAAAARAHLAEGVDVAIGPALDGGYYLAAMRRPAPELFAIDPGAWGGPDVLERTLEAAAGAGLTTALLGPERDLDTPEDAEQLLDDPELGDLLGRVLARPQA